MHNPTLLFPSNSLRRLAEPLARSCFNLNENKFYAASHAENQIHFAAPPGPEVSIQQFIAGLRKKLFGLPFPDLPEASRLQIAT
jgi:hypothetical protein